MLPWLLVSMPLNLVVENDGELGCSCLSTWLFRWQSHSSDHPLLDLPEMPKNEQSMMTMTKEVHLFQWPADAKL